MKYDLPPGAPRKNLVLVGFMGCGKSCIGRRLAEKLNYPLQDTDDIIEDQQQRKISDIFAADGEPVFRDMETAVLRDLIAAKTHKNVISTGGGIVTTPGNIDLLKQLGYVIWLDARVETVLERTSRNTNRPLLQTDDPEQTIRTLSDQRRPLYTAASHLRIETDGLDFDEIVTGILETARYYFGNQR